MSRRLSLILAEDDPEMLLRIRSALTGLVAEIAIVRSGWELLARLSERRVDLVISDVRMPEPSGMRALRMARELGHRMPFLIIGAVPDPEARLRTRALGAELLEVAFSEADLVTAIQALTAGSP
jgi:CheY-like chemotaxis protein